MLDQQRPNPLLKKSIACVIRSGCRGHQTGNDNGQPTVSDRNYLHRTTL
jgi:hypothetical protein